MSSEDSISFELIQKHLFSLPDIQKKAVLFIASQIVTEGPEDEYSISLSEFGKVCGIDTSGPGYDDLKDLIQAISDNSIWARLPNGGRTCFRWIERPYINKGNDILRISVSDHMKPYILRIKKDLAGYDLVFSLLGDLKEQLQSIDKRLTRLEDQRQGGADNG